MITWLWDAMDANGARRTDTKNRDRAARGTPLVGTRILSGFRRGQGDVWRGGKVYNPDNGRTYSGTIRLLPRGTLELKGCALNVFCQTRIWQRPAEVSTAAGVY